MPQSAIRCPSIYARGMSLRAERLSDCPHQSLIRDGRLSRVEPRYRHMVRRGAGVCEPEALAKADALPDRQIPNGKARAAGRARMPPQLDQLAGAALLGAHTTGPLSAPFHFSPALLQSLPNRFEGDLDGLRNQVEIGF